MWKCTFQPSLRKSLGKLKKDAATESYLYLQLTIEFKFSWTRECGYLGRYLEANVENETENHRKENTHDQGDLVNVKLNFFN